MRDIPPGVLFDKRLVDRHLKQGLISQEQLDKHLAGISDSTELGEAIDLDVLMEQHERERNGEVEA